MVTTSWPDAVAASALFLAIAAVLCTWIWSRR